MNLNSLRPWLLCLVGICLPDGRAQLPENLVLQGIPPIPQDLRSQAAPYLETRAAVFQSWHPRHPEMLVTTRFSETMQVHLVKMPGGARRQLTFLSEPVGDALFQPGTGESIVYSQDTGGGEFYQLYRYELANGRVTLLTDGHSRNTGARWSDSGKWLAYTSTRRTGRDNDIYIVDPSDPSSTRMVFQVTGGGWRIEDWSPDESKLVLLEYLSINESKLHLADLKAGSRSRITPDTKDKVAFQDAQFSQDGKTIYVTTDQDSEFRRLAKLDPNTGDIEPLTSHIPWDVGAFDVSPGGDRIAFVTNEDGVSKLHFLDTATEQPLPALDSVPTGVISNVRWHGDGARLGFTLTSARSPNDAYSVNLTTNGWKLERWTESETGGLNPDKFVQPELIKVESFGQIPISAFVFRPDRGRFPGKRPVLIMIHGGPESQARPVFQARNNYFLNELGIALVYPNVRGSAGYGKTFLTLDNGMKREDSVRDIGTILDWVKGDPGLDRERVAVYGGSYGGYMVLASLVHFSDRLRCGIDIVGISNFLTFLKNTQDYRRDLRRAEYGDERDDEMRQFLDKISPNNNVSKIKRPLLVVQGKNDPRVPLGESEQMVQALRDQGGTVWYLMAKDEGHGFAKKPNADVQFLVTIQFLLEHLLR